MHTRKLLPPILALGFALLLTFGFSLWYSNLAPAVKKTDYADTTIRLTASRGVVLFPGDCLLIQWDVFNTLRVLVNDELLPGVGEKTLCIDAATQPTFQIMLMDGSEVTLNHPVTILMTHPLFVMVAILTIGLFCLGFFLLMRVIGIAGQSSLRVIVRGGLSASVVLTVILSLGVTLLGIEFALRAYFSANGSREQKIMYLYSLEEIRGMQSRIIPVPYVSFLPDPAYEGHNELGYRGPEIVIPKPETVFRIVAMGGSTTYSTGTTAQASYPAFLQDILRNEYGYQNVEVINAGVSGYTSWEILAGFAFRVLELEPDMLIYYGAVNDLIVREWMSVDCYRGMNPQRGLNGMRGLFVEKNAELPASALWRLFAIELNWMPNPLALDSSFEPSRVRCQPDPGATTLEQRLAANEPIYFERNIRSLINLALAHGAQPVLSSWIYNVAADRPPLWRQSIAQHNEVTREISLDMDIPYIDLEADFPVNNTYWEVDGIHLVASGTREQASRYAAFLDENGLLPKP